MKTVFNIPLNGEFNFYLLFYLFSFSIAFLIVFSHFIKNRKDRLFLSAVTAAIFLAFVFGCKLVSFIEDILVAKNNQPWLYQTKQIGLGGVTLSFLLVIFFRQLFNIPGKYLYGLGFAILLGFMLEKPGCLIGGCCRGMEGASLFSITYLDAVIRHPLQLYEMGFYLVAIVILRKIRVTNLDSKYFIAIILFCVVQFSAEFIKDPSFTLVFAETFVGIKIIQWIYLSLALIASMFWYVNETRNISAINRINTPSILVSGIILIMVIIVFFLIHPFLFQLEIYAINLALLPSLILLAYSLFNHFTIPKYRWLSFSMLVLPLFLMSQTLPINKGKQHVYKTIGVGYHGGKFTNHIVNDTNPGECGGIIDTNDFENKYNVISVGYSITKVREKSKFNYGINATFGEIEETSLVTNISTKGTIVSLNPYILNDWKWFGIGAGLHVGSNYYAMANAVHKGTGIPDTGLGTSPILPQAHIRVGPKRFFAIEYNFANQFPSALPAFTHEFVIGSGFGIKNDFYIKYGAIFGSQAYYESGSYVSGYIPIANKVVVEPLIGLRSMKNVYMLGLSYRFGHKETEYDIANSNFD